MASLQGELTQSTPARRPLRLGHPSDSRLVKRAAGGESDAFAAIFDRYEQELYRFCLGILGESQDAQDAVQNAMVKALKALPGEHREMQLRPWLYRIAHNEAVELRRRERPSEPLHQAAAARDPELDERVDQDDQVHKLLEDVADLPDRQRAALVMREMNGLEFSEIGAALGTSPGAIRQALYEARRGLEQMRDGRAMECDSAARQISDSEGKPVEREIRAHVRECRQCRRFQAEIRHRRETFSAIAPLPAIAAAALLKGALGGGSGGAAGAGTGAAGGTVVGVGAGSIGGSMVAKTLAGVLAVVAIGGAADHGGLVSIGDAGRPQASASAVAGAVGPSRISSAVRGRLVVRPSPTEVHGRDRNREAAADVGARQPGFAPTRRGQQTTPANAASPGPPESELIDRTATSSPGAAPGDQAPTLEAPTAEAEAPGQAKKEAKPEAPGQAKKSEEDALVIEPQAERQPPPDQLKKEEGAVPPVQAKTEAGVVPSGQATKEAAPPPPGQAKKEGTTPPAGQAKKEDGSLPPGQAKKEESAALPPGQLKKESTVVPSGQATKEAAPPPPGQAKKEGAAPPAGQEHKAAAPSPGQATKEAPSHGQAKKETGSLSEAETEAASPPVEARPEPPGQASGDSNSTPPGQAKKSAASAPPEPQAPEPSPPASESSSVLAL